MLSKLSATATLDQASWDKLDQLIDQVESRWRQGQPTNLAQLNLPASGPLRERALVELIKVDQDFRFRAGAPRRLEEYFREWPELAANPAIASELLTAECLTQSEHGTIPTRAELRARFPEFGDVMELPATEVLEAHSAAARSHGRGLVVDANLVGQPFGRYEIRELLGHGGMGTVYRALDRPLGREVALKVPRADLVDDPVVLERFLREARAAAGVRHPHVCPIYDVGEFEGTYFLSMALVEGESLASLLQRGPLPPERATELIRKLASALARVHQAGVVHRDIKPANVMIDEAGEPLLMDFGLARLAEFQSREPLTEPVSCSRTRESSENRLATEQSLTTVDRSLATSATARIDAPVLSGSTRMGTPAYMSPEQAGDDPQSVDARSDLYSLGVVLAQLLTGQLPNDGASPDVPPIGVFPNIDPVLADVVRRAMARRREDRFQTASEFVAALDAAQVARRGAGSTSQFAHSWQRLRVPILVVVLAVVGLMGVIHVLSDKEPSGTERLAGNSHSENTTIEPPPLIDSPPDAQAVPVEAPFSPEQAAEAQQVWAKHLGMDVEITNSIGMTLRLIPPGSFLMGTTAEELEALLKTAPDWNKRNIQTEGPARDMVIDQPFYLGTREVTVGQFRAFVTESNYQTWAERPGNAGRVYNRETERLQRRPGLLWNDKFVAPTEKHPVVLVHREDADAFCEWLSQKEGTTYELPNEEWWEFACRAGSMTPWYWGAEESRIHEFAWFRDPLNASQQMAVGLRLANPFGLYDMAGNVSELVISPQNSVVLRGGNASYPPIRLRSASREIPDHNDPTHRNGFRVLRRLSSRESP